MTPYDDILDLALMSISDYRLDKLAVEKPNDFKTVLTGFLIRGIANFDNCRKDLSNRDDNEKVFNFALNDIEKSILADWTVIMWLDKEINDVRQITAMLQNNKEAHRYSEASNLNAKLNRRIQLKEDVAYKQTKYSYSGKDWGNWENA